MVRPAPKAAAWRRKLRRFTTSGIVHRSFVGANGMGRGLTLKRLLNLRPSAAAVLIGMQQCPPLWGLLGTKRNAPEDYGGHCLDRETAVDGPP